MKHDNDNGEKIHTLSEASEHLRLTNRAVAKIAKRHGLCMVAGRNILFTDSDIEKIKEILRCPSNSNSVVKSGGSAALYGAQTQTANLKASASTKARELVIARSRKPSAQKLKHVS